MSNLRVPAPRSLQLPLRQPLSAPVPAGRPVAPAPPRPAYDGVTLPDVTVARGWKPGDRTLDGSAANRLVTETYTKLDAGMTAYLGTPAVPNWMTFGKYASRGAGEQILRMEEIMKVIRDKDADSLVDSVQDLVKHPFMLGEQGFELMKFSKGNPFAFVRNTERMHGALVFGNTGVYADLAPAYDLFLRAEAAGKNGVTALEKAGFGRAPRDPQGFMLGAFKLYQEARKLGVQAAGQDATASAKLLARRQAITHRANLLLGIHEQMVILQGPEVFGDPQVGGMLGGMTSQLTLTDATGTHRLLPNGGNWADFAERMGFVEVEAGSDPQAIRVEDHQGVVHHYVVNPDPKARAGTIAQYFKDGLAPEATATLIGHEPAPLPGQFRDGNDFKRWFDKAWHAPLGLAHRAWDAVTSRFDGLGAPSLAIEG